MTEQFDAIEESVLRESKKSRFGVSISESVRSSHQASKSSLLETNKLARFKDLFSDYRQKDPVTLDFYLDMTVPMDIEKYGITE